MSFARCPGIRASALALLVTTTIHARPDVELTRSADVVDCHDFIEITLTTAPGRAKNPFVDASLTGEFISVAADGMPPVRAEGFCDADDGSVFRIRYMPDTPGRHRYRLALRIGGEESVHQGEFTARPGSRPGPVRVDGDHPFHFVRQPGSERWFWSGTTAYWLLGWKRDEVIRECIDRFARHRVSRIRVALNGRTTDGARWMEPQVKPTDEFRFRLAPWPAARPDDTKSPGYDVTRFDLAHFRKCERMLRHARDRDVIVSIIFHLDGRDPGVDPFGKERMGGPDEQRYYRYVVARLAAFSNVMWDITNEWHLFRDEAWVDRMGALVKEADPYDHVASVHGKEVFPFRKSPWADFALYQSWDEHGAYDFMLRNREEQKKAGRPMPQANEEFGYEDHYPYPWGEARKAPARAAATRRRIAWEITMAGCYATTGERADVPGRGGWITGRGDDSMKLLEDHARMRAFFEAASWWKAEPRPDLVKSGSKEARCLARPGELYILYLPNGGEAKLAIEKGPYRVRRFDPRGGEWKDLPDASGTEWRAASPDAEDWAFLLAAR